MEKFLSQNFSHLLPGVLTPVINHVLHDQGKRANHLDPPLGKLHLA
jgi:hypothetical protein